MIKIQIPDKDESARAFVELARSSRIACLPNDIYMVPEPALALLRTLGISFRQLAPGDNGHAAPAFRGPAADPLQ
jgi:hypothetical protein